MDAVVVNFAGTTLAAAAAADAVVISLAPPYFPPLPAGRFYAAVLQAFGDRSLVEVVHVVAVSGADISVVRGREGTVPLAFSAGDLCGVRLTAGLFGPLLEHPRDKIAHVPASTGAGRYLRAGSAGNQPEWGHISTPSAESITSNPDGSIASHTAVIDGLTSVSEFTYAGGNLVQERTVFDGVITTTTHTYSGGDWVGSTTTKEGDV